MSTQSADGAIAKTIGHSISAILGVVITWLTAGSTSIGSGLVALFTILGGLSGPICFLIYRRYVGVLGAGAKAKGSPARRAYDSMRESLSGGNMAARVYASRLSAFLDAVDRFFGDAGLVGRTLFPHAFGLRTPAPLWTAPAFDRCLLLALIYPVATIFVIWAVSGHVGPAEDALLLEANVSGGRRGVASSLVVFFTLTVWFARRAMGWKSVALLALAGGCALASLFVGAGTTYFLLLSTLAVLGVSHILSLVGISISISISIGAVAVFLAIATAIAGAVTNISISLGPAVGAVAIACALTVTFGYLSRKLLNLIGKVSFCYASFSQWYQSVWAPPRFWLRASIGAYSGQCSYFSDC